MPASAWAQEREKLREEQRDEYLRERSKLKRLEELSQGYVPPSSVTADGADRSWPARRSP